MGYSNDWLQFNHYQLLYVIMKNQLLQLAKNIDSVLDSQDDVSVQLNGFLKGIETLKSQNPSPFELAQLDFYAANIYADSNFKQSKTNSDFMEKNIYHLRLSHAAFHDVPSSLDNSDLRYRVETNLGVALSSVGRFVEALERWDSVIEKCPGFGMAHASKGKVLFDYAQHLYDKDQKPIFLKYSHISINKALELGVEEHAKGFYSNLLNYINSIANWGSISIETSKRIPGRSKHERTYRQWGLHNRLFLNPLNDIEKTADASYDNLHLPSFVTPISATPPEVYGIFNQLKQEYISARYILFEAIEESQKTSLHFSDRQVHLVDMLDGRFYRLWVEKAKMAFLGAYAIFDKIAYLINEFWKLGWLTKDIDFRKVWYENLKQPNNGVNHKFQMDQNWSLKGLFWLSKDIYYKNADRPTEPDAKQLNHIRNHISHKYLKVQHSCCNPNSYRKSNGHELTYPIDENELQEQTIKLLKLVRSALIYLSLAVERQAKETRQTEQGLTGSMQMFDVGEQRL